MKRKVATLMSIMLIATMMISTAVHAEPELSTPVEEVQSLEFAILDTATYGIDFSTGQIYCFADFFASNAKKYVIEGAVFKKNSQGEYIKLYDWGPDTASGKTAYVDEYFPLQGTGKYMMIIYVDIYSDTDSERIVLTKYRDY